MFIEDSQKRNFSIKIQFAQFGQSPCIFRYRGDHSQPHSCCISSACVYCTRWERILPSLVARLSKLSPFSNYLHASMKAPFLRLTSLRPRAQTLFLIVRNYCKGVYTTFCAGKLKKRNIEFTHYKLKPKCQLIFPTENGREVTFVAFHSCPPSKSYAVRSC